MYQSPACLKTRCGHKNLSCTSPIWCYVVYLVTMLLLVHCCTEGRVSWRHQALLSQELGAFYQQYHYRLQSLTRDASCLHHHYFHVTIIILMLDTMITFGYHVAWIWECLMVNTCLMIRPTTLQKGSFQFILLTNWKQDGPSSGANLAQHNAL